MIKSYNDFTIIIETLQAYELFPIVAMIEYFAIKPVLSSYTIECKCIEREINNNNKKELLMVALETWILQ